MNATASIDDGKYKCTLGSTDDRNPREHIEFDLKIYRITSFKDTARHLVLPVGSNGALNCRVEFDSGVISSSISWVRNQIPIEMYNDSSYVVTDYDQSRQLSQLTISPLTKHHDGIYTCRAVAVTPQLSKIFDHDIRLETNYAPTFDQDQQTVWVERLKSSSVEHTSATSNTYSSNPHKLNEYSRSPIVHYKKRPRMEHKISPAEEETGSQSNNSTSGAQIVRIDLNCTCQSNPPASIIWTSTQNSMYSLGQYVLTKGSPAHILEEPKSIEEGHYTTSILSIAYNLDADWANKRDTYSCSASNRLGKATKTFSIEQGDPPPAFHVGPEKQYNPLTTLFKFTLLGPNFDPEAGKSSEHQQQLSEIVPPVDSFRIRAENPTSGSDSKSSYSAVPSSRRHSEPNVQWTVRDQHLNNDRHNDILKSPANIPQNFTISLSRLPSGNQKLFLEAHNAVGWSPNATYLGDYYIVSGASSLSATSSHLYISLATFLLTLANLLLSSSSSVASAAAATSVITLKQMRQ